jgi:hypothetical protein
VPLHILVSKWVRYMSSKSHTHKRCGTLRKKSFSTRGYAEVHIRRPFFDNKNSIWNILGLKIQTVKTCSRASSISTNFYFWKILKSRFLVEFQSFIFGQILASLGSFGQILLYWQWLTACPNLGWNLKNLITISPNVTYSVSLESYHPYLPPQKVSKILKIECIHNSLPKITKSHIHNILQAQASRPFSTMQKSIQQHPRSAATLDSHTL